VSFIHPLALLGLVAATIPALLHLLQRRVPPEVDFPPVRYLSVAERESARRLKLRHLLLLILRTALIVSIVLAAARPLVPLRGGGAHQPTAAVIILDNSPSSGAIVDGGSVLDRLRVLARSSIARLTPVDRLWLMLCDGVVRGGTREALLATVDSTRPGWQRLDLVQAVERAARIVDAQPLAGREVHVLSDLQRTALASGHARVPRGVRVLALAPGHEVSNHGIAGVTVSEGAAIIELAGSSPDNSGPPAPVPVTIRIGAGRQGGGRGEIAARGLATPDRAARAARSAVTVSLPAQSLTAGWWVGEASLEPDELRAGSFAAAALSVLQEGKRVVPGRDVVISSGESPPPTGAHAIVQPPADPALLGQANRAIAARGLPWRWTLSGTPGVIVAPALPFLTDVPVARRYRLEETGSQEPGAGDVLATVNGEPWLVRSGDVVLLGSRLDTAWTALPAAPGFVPFIDALANRIVVGEADVAVAEGAPRVEFRTRGSDTIGATVYGLDGRESDLTPAAVSLATDALGGADVLDADHFAAERFSGMRRADASGILILLALLLAAAELGVATRTR